MFACLTDVTHVVMMCITESVLTLYPKVLHRIVLLPFRKIDIYFGFSYFILEGGIDFFLDN